MTRAPTVPSELRALLADRTSVPRPSGPGARSAAMLHAHALQRVAQALQHAGVDDLLTRDESGLELLLNEFNTLGRAIHEAYFVV